MTEHSHTHSGHHHHHHHGTDDMKDGRLVWSIILNLIITLAELIGGIISNSLSLLSDALHNFSDTASLGISLAARKIGKKEADQFRTFGYKRAEIIGAFINLIVLVIVSIYLINEGVHRFFKPEPIDGPVMFIVAIIGLLGNFISAGLLFRDSKKNLNMRSAYLHILSDGLSSIGVLIAGLVIMFYHVYILDTILTIGIAAYILIESYSMLRETIDILMEGAPEDLDISEVISSTSSLEGVKNIHHVHIWKIDENQICLEAHVRIDKRDLEEMESIKRNIKDHLISHFDIAHSTLEFEFEKCNDQVDHNCAEVVGEHLENI